MEDSWWREKDLINAVDLLRAYQLKEWNFTCVHLLLTSGVSWTFRGIPCTLQAPFLRGCVMPGAHFLLVWLDPWGEGFPILFVIWIISIHPKISHPLGVGYSGGGECKCCCLGGL